MALILTEQSFAQALTRPYEDAAPAPPSADESDVQWLFCFLNADRRKTYCLYEAPSTAVIAQSSDLRRDDAGDTPLLPPG